MLLSWNIVCISNNVFSPNMPKGKYPVCTKEGPIDDVSTSKGLRRSLRKTRVVIGDNDDESEATERES